MHMEERKNDLCERLFEFAVKVIEFLKTLPYTLKTKLLELNYQKMHALQVQTMKNLSQDPQILILLIKVGSHFVK